MKHTVELIKKRAAATLEHHKGKRGDVYCGDGFTLRKLRFYVEQVLFLCKEVDKLRKKK